ncbi:MAG: flagellar hook protein [SAR86 cluster bacterium]|uniref:Flagellar hook-associated protein 2 n=1 Tax=SAR86 cluster bacterium TaxID=2030880 RepID=A0A2A4XH65_9GAMM|nr:MAG: flagellar hook protein [SAR86 cluster bacterium]
MLTATGLGSGLDVNSLVSQLVASERAVSDLQLNRQQANLNSKFSALGALKGSLGGFKSALSGLNTLSSFDLKTATSSDSSIFTATASTDALPSNYSIAVSQLATSHSLASLSFADSNETVIGTGTLTIRRGTTDYVAGTDTYNSFTLNQESTAANITIDSSNNTLEGVMTAINDADIGIGASIINDGSGFRLLLSSETTGAENSLEIVVTDDDLDNIDNTSGLSRLAFNAAATNLEQTNAAVDANFTINGLAITSASNDVSSAIPGVSLNLKKISVSAVDLSIEANTSSVLSGVSSFIAGYNSYIGTANALSNYDQENDVAAALLGDFTLRSIGGQIDNVVRSSVAGLAGSITNLSELGITTSASGTLLLDGDKFTAALSDHPQQVSQMFTAIAVPEDEEVLFTSSTAATAVGTYAVNVSSLASAGVMSGGGVLPDFSMGGSVVVDATNNNLTFEIDGVTTSEITLSSATYTSGEDLAAELQVQLNGAQELLDVGRSVTVTYESGSNRLSIVSNSLGSTSKVDILAIDATTTASLGFSVSAGVVGTDVVGTINGELATGAGNVLVGDSGTAAEGLNLTITGTTTGNRGNVTFTRGIANQLDSLLDSILLENGPLESRIETLQDRMDDVVQKREDLELRWEEVESRYTRQFNTLDALLAGLENTSNYLEQQFDNLLKPNFNR